MTLAAWYYARKSPSDTDEQVGVDSQKRQCVAEIERRGWRLAGGFEDVARSAYEAQYRPGYEALLAAIRAGQVDAIVVRHNDRLHRDVAEYKAFTKLVRKHGVQVVAVLGGDWTIETAAGRFTGTMLAAVAELESAIKSERVLSGALLRRAEAGLPAHTRHRPFGFEADGITHRRAEVELLRRAAADIVAGRRSLGDVAREAGRTTTGMRKILTSPRLVGVRVFQGVEYPAVWEPVLDRETFELLRVFLSGRATGPGTARERRWLLTGLARCGSCGKPLRARQTRGVAVYGCLTAAGNDCPRKVQRQADRLEAFVVNEVIDALAAGERRPHSAADNAEAAAAIVRLERRLAEIEEQLAEADAPVAVLSRAYSRVEAQIGELRGQVTLVPVAPLRVEGTAVAVPGTEWQAWWNGADLAERRALLAEHLAAIHVMPTRHGRLPLDRDAVRLEWR